MSCNRCSLALSHLESITAIPMSCADRHDREALILDRAVVHDEMEQARIQFRDLVGRATPADLRRRSNGTRWTNRQLLFHMMFGYLVVRTLMPLVHAFGKRPASCSRRFAATLNAGQRPFHLINYLGSCGGGQVLPTSTMIRLMDRTIHSLQRKLAAETKVPIGAAMRLAEPRSATAD